MKIVIEPSGATPHDALLAGRIERVPSRVGLIVSGGNVDARRFAELCTDSAAKPCRACAPSNGGPAAGWCGRRGPARCPLRPVRQRTDDRTGAAVRRGGGGQKPRKTPS